MSKLESILFNSDEGPVSSLLRQADTDDDNTTDQPYQRIQDVIVKATTTTASTPTATATATATANSTGRNSGYSKKSLMISTTTVTTSSSSPMNHTQQPWIGSSISPSSALSPQSILSDDNDNNNDNDMDHDDHDDTIINDTDVNNSNNGTFSPQQPLLTSPSGVSSSTTTGSAVISVQLYDKLRNQIQALQKEVQQERILLKRKDKNIVKLAKELSLRTQKEVQLKQNMEECIETIYDLEQRLQDRTQQMNDYITLQNSNNNNNNAENNVEHKSTSSATSTTAMTQTDNIVYTNSMTQTPSYFVQQEQKDSSTQTTTTASTHNSIDDIDVKNSNMYYSPSLLDESEQSNTTSTAPAPATATATTTTNIEVVYPTMNNLLLSSQQDDGITHEMISTESKVISEDTKTTVLDRNLNRIIQLCIIILLLFHMFWTMYLPYTTAIVVDKAASIMNMQSSSTNSSSSRRSIVDTIMDVICAPVIPGMTWTFPHHNNNENNTNSTDRPLVYEAPWWVALPTMKDSIFDTICTKRRQRIRFEVYTNGIILYRYHTNSSTTIMGQQQTLPNVVLLKDMSMDGAVCTISSTNTISIHRQLQEQQHDVVPTGLSSIISKWCHPCTKHDRNYYNSYPQLPTTQLIVQHIQAPWTIRSSSEIGN